MNKPEEFVVRVTRPEGVGVTEMKWYIEEAVAIWCKSGNPEEPLFYLDGEKVKCLGRK